MKQGYVPNALTAISLNRMRTSARSSARKTNTSSTTIFPTPVEIADHIAPIASTQQALVTLVHHSTSLTLTEWTL
jgi:hypothetical protein